jgi:hypothetical protein
MSPVTQATAGSANGFVNSTSQSVVTSTSSSVNAMRSAVAIAKPAFLAQERPRRRSGT